MALKDARLNEQRIARRLITDLIAAGFYLAVFDGEEQTTEPTQDVAKLEEALCTTDEDRLRVFYPGAAQLGAVWLIWGNGCDLLSDWSDRPALETVIRGALDEADAVQAEELMQEVRYVEAITDGDGITRRLTRPIRLL